jgi:hypothetical protein
MLVNFHFFRNLFSLLLGGWHFGRDGDESKRLGFCQEHRGTQEEEEREIRVLLRARVDKGAKD